MRTFKFFFKFLSLLMIVGAFWNPIQAQNINKPNIQAPGGLQVNSFTGNLFYQRTDFMVPGDGLPIEVTFSYNSYRDTLDIGFGYGWTFGYNMYYFQREDTLYIERMDGRRDGYKISENGQSFQAPAGIFDVLTLPEAGKYLLTTKGGMKYFFEDATHKKLTKIEDSNGNILNLSYTSDLLTGISNASGRSVSFTWIDGLLRSISENNSQPERVANLTYNNNKLLVKVTHPDGQAIDYQYRNRNLNQITDKNGNEYRIEYNTAEQVKSIVSCLSVQRFTFNTENRKTYVIEENFTGKQLTTYLFDENENLIKKEGNCCGFDTSFEYDNDRNITKRTNGNGNQDNYTYDARGNLLSSTDANGARVQMQYEPNFNRITQVNDKRNNTTAYQYDGSGNLTGITQPLGITQAFTYNDKGNVLSSRDGRGNLINFTYDTNGNLSQTSYPIGSESYEYDALGNLTKTTDANGNPVEFTYDNLNRLTKLKDALNQEVAYQYDGNGNLTTQTDPKNQTTQYGYDALDRLVSVDLPIDALTMFGYDGVGNLTSIVDANGNTNLYQYNNKNLLETEIDAMGKQTRYTYDNVGNLTSRTDANGNTTTYQYDALNRLVRKSYNGNTDEYEYDANGNLTRCKNNHIEMLFTYDALNRLITKNVPTWGKSISYTYDANGNRTSMTDPSGTTTYTYDANNRLTGITNPQGESITFVYDNAGRMTRQNNFNGTYSLYTYDNADRLTALVHYNPDNQVFASYTYTYDANGNRTAMLTTEGTHTYTYDQADRVTGVSYANGTIESYVLDKTGNRTQLTRNGEATAYSYDTGDRLQSAGTDTFTFDDNGNLISKTNTEGTTTYQYDGENRLIQINLPNGNIVAYQYDPFGNRIRKAQGTAETRYLLDGQNVLMELDALDNTTARYTAGLGLDTWLSMERNGVKYLYHKDGLGSITALTNDVASTAATYQYDIYGNLQAQTGNVANPYTYTGREYDAEADLYYYRSRYYDAKVGRFVTKDGMEGIAMQPLSLNKYAYVEANPVKFIDSDGNLAFLLPFVAPLVSTGIRTFAGYVAREFLSKQARKQIVTGLKWGAGIEVIKSRGNLNCISLKNIAIDGLTKFNPLDVVRDIDLLFKSTAIKQLANQRGTRNAGKRDRDKIVNVDEVIEGIYGGNVKYFLEKQAFEQMKSTITDAFKEKCDADNGSQDPNSEVAFIRKIVVPIVVAFDPNDITGPSGYGVPQWVAKTQTLNYTVRFENDPDFATAPAQNVIIRIPVDSTLNLQTLEFGDFGFGSFTFAPPSNGSSFTNLYDVSDSLGVLVEVLAGYDIENNDIFWIFESKDPRNGLAPQDAQAGFLPVNDSLVGNGEGFVTFRIGLKENVITGDSARAQANIVFDINEPIFTNRWHNVIDAVAPSSKVSDIPEQITSPYEVSFEGSDDAEGSGLKHVDLYVSEEGAPFRLLQAAIPIDSTYQFVGEAGKNYCLFSRAVDNAGNIEAAKIVGDACFTAGEPDPNAPQIIRFDPARGIAGITQVTLTGRNLTGTSNVRFNGFGANQFSVVNDSTVTAIVPLTATTGRISLNTPEGFAITAEDFEVCQAEESSVSITASITGNEVTLGTLVVFTATPIAGGDAPTYQWRLNGQLAGTNSPTFSADNFRRGINTITVTMISSNPCAVPQESFSNEIVINVTNLENELDQALKIYPNPSPDGKYQVVFEGMNFDKVQISLMDIQGKVMFAQEKRNISTEFLLNFSHLAGGAYYIRFETDKGTVWRKLVKN